MNQLIPIIGDSLPSGVWRILAGCATIEFFNSELRQKNDQIIELQHQSAGAITGGDSFVEMALEVPDVTPGAVAMPVSTGPNSEVEWEDKPIPRLLRSNNGA
jgi:hypothetical protein